ncbi:hypothetical protein LTR37_017309 [Vermiconidia calcicola]|uniref:Uncharacterized protein n=1 Tax=Vermiconidia calcicola TaxID=1690605 RepID=A0ACC3MKN7_9PEZI|nr:hypothetical protein LTR37_017309 [Vermiconidia calcicola]
MSMLLTISQPPRTEFGSRTTHDFSPRISLAKSRLSPKTKVDSPMSSLRASVATDNSSMSNHHRGLPPPSSMTLPDPGRPPPSLSQQSLNQPLGAMPAPPNQWQGQEESMRNWLAAKTEEDKRKQEEERTRQESYRLEQRRIEQSMLRESLQAGVPPAMVPMIYAGIAGSNMANISVDYLERYAAQLQAAQQQIQQQQPSPEIRRETRLIGQAPGSFPAQHAQPQQILPSQHSEQQQQPAPLQTTFSAYQPAPGRPQPTSVPRSATHTQLPRLTTNEMYVHQPAQQQGPGSAHPLHQSQTVHQDQPASSPSIYFHHWVPPNESKSTHPPTPSGKGDPHSAHPGSHISESEYKESPRKRKAQGPHQPAPPPSSGPLYTSPSFSVASSGTGRRAGHVRSRSNTSTRENDSRPDSRREQQEPPRLMKPESTQSSAEDRRPGESSQASEDRMRRSSMEAQHQQYRAERPESRGSR